MKITDVRTVLLTGPSTYDPYLREADETRSAAFIEIHTDAKIIGLGETYAGYFFPEAVPGIVDFFKPILMGQDVENIPELWSRMYHCGNFWCRVGLGAIVLAGIESALWDLRGKQLDLPVHQILGEGCCHEKLPYYATGGPSNYPLDKLAEKLDYYLSLGFRGFKIGAGSFQPETGHVLPRGANEAAQFEADKLAFVRQRVGGDVRVMLDGHMNEHPPESAWDLEVAKGVMAACEPYDLFFFEEPLSYRDPEAYAELCRSTSISIAGGECLTSLIEWRPYLHAGSFDIGQPDASFTAGLGETVKVANELENQERQMATHSWGAGGSLMQNVHVAFSCANTAIVEVAADYGPLHSEVIGDSLRCEEGFLLPPESPGLGIVLTEKLKQRFPFVPGSGAVSSVPGKMREEDLKVRS